MAATVLEETGCITLDESRQLRTAPAAISESLRGHLRIAMSDVAGRAVSIGPDLRLAIAEAGVSLAIKHPGGTIPA
jgi:hypothetical protein